MIMTIDVFVNVDQDLNEKNIEGNGRDYIST